MSEHNVVSVKDFMVKPLDETKEIKLDRLKSPFVIRPLSEKEYSDIRTRNTRQVPAKGGMKIPQVDSNKANVDTVVASIVSPDLHDVELQTYFGTQPSASDTLSAMLRAGEFMTLIQAVLDLSGFDQDLEELKDDAKNE